MNRAGVYKQTQLVSKYEIAKIEEILRSIVTVEIQFVARTMDEFKRHAEALNLFSIEKIAAVVASARESGVVTPFFETFTKPENVTIASTNYRETLSANGLNSRKRALLFWFAREVGALPKSRLKLHIAEALSPLSLMLRGVFVGAHCTEYTSSKRVAEELYPIPIEDLCALSFPDACFDFQLSSDVLEHVPSIPNALRESFRVLKRDGALICTFPFGYWAPSTTIRASLSSSGEVVHILPAQYHGDPLSPEGALVFGVPGWDIVASALSLGFSDAYFAFVSSARYGIVGADCACIMIFVAKK